VKNCRLGQGAALNHNFLVTFAVVFHADDCRDIISLKIKLTYTNTHVCVCVFMQGVSGGIVNMLGGNSMDLLTYSMVLSPS